MYNYIPLFYFIPPCNSVPNSFTSVVKKHRVRRRVTPEDEIVGELRKEQDMYERAVLADLNGQWVLKLSDPNMSGTEFKARVGDSDI